MNQIQSQIPLTSREAKARRWSKLSKVLAVIILFASIILLITSGALDWLLDTLTGKQGAATAALSENAAAAAAENGLKTLYTVDYEAGYEEWASALCAISSEKGCNAMLDMFGSSMKANMETYKTDQVVSAVKAIQMVDERATQGIHRQMWAVEITTRGWSEEQTDLALAAVVEKAGSWKFEMLLPVPNEMLLQMLTPTAVP